MTEVTHVEGADEPSEDLTPEQKLVVVPAEIEVEEVNDLTPTEDNTDDDAAAADPPVES